MITKFLKNMKNEFQILKICSAQRENFQNKNSYTTCVGTIVIISNKTQKHEKIIVKEFFNKNSIKMILIWIFLPKRNIVNNFPSISLF